MQKKLIEKIEAKAKEMGVNAVIAVANEGGNIVAVECMDDSYIASYDIAVNKAFTCASLKMSTSQLKKLAQPGCNLYGIQFTNNGRIVIFGGGEPLKSGDKTIGGLGVSGGSEKQLMGKEFASEQLVTLVGPSLRAIEKVRVLGPVRKQTQVEISRTDTFVLKVSPPVRPSGEIEGSEKIVIVGPKGTVYLKQGVIIANRHIHLTPEFAQKHGIKDNDYVDVLVESVKPTKFFDVHVRTRDDFNIEMHIDTDDANSAGIKNGDKVKIIKNNPIERFL